VAHLQKERVLAKLTDEKRSSRLVRKTEDGLPDGRAPKPAKEVASFMKKLVLVVLLMFAAVTFGAGYRDVPASHWAYKAVMELAKKGIMKGYPDGTFKGNKPVTRFELAKILVKVLDEVKSGEIKLSDEDYATIQKLTVELADELSLLGVKVSTLEDELANLKKDVAKMKVGGTGGAEFKHRVRAVFLTRSFDGKKVQGGTVDEPTLQGAMIDWTLKVKKDLDEKTDVCVSGYVSNGNFDDNLKDQFWSGMMDEDSVSKEFTMLDAYINLKEIFGWGSLKLGRWIYRIGDGTLFANRPDFVVEFKNKPNADKLGLTLAAIRMDEKLAISNPDNNMFDAYYAALSKEGEKYFIRGYYFARIDDHTSNERISPNYAGLDFELKASDNYNFTLFGSFIKENVDEREYADYMNAEVATVKGNLTGLASGDVDEGNMFKIGFRANYKDDWKFQYYFAKSDKHFGLDMTGGSADYRLHHESAQNDDLLMSYYLVHTAAGYNYVDYLTNIKAHDVTVIKKINDRCDLRLDYVSLENNDSDSKAFLNAEHDAFQGIVTYKYSKHVNLKLKVRNYTFDDDASGGDQGQDYTDVRCEVVVNF